MFKSSSSLFSALAANVTAPIIGKENVLELRKFYQPFGYHLVQPSPWPILVSFSLLAVTLGLTMYMHGYLHNSIQIILALSLTTFGISLWLRDVILEATFLGDHTKEVTDNIVMGIVLFIVSEVFVFLSVFWAAFHSALSPSIAIGGNWPPVGISSPSPYSIPLFNTIILLSSGAYLTLAHHGLISKRRNISVYFLYFVIVLAALFTGLQVFEYFQAGFSMSDSVYGSTFFASTGLHGIHVILGTIFLTVGLFRHFYFHYTNNHHVGLEFAIYYWQKIFLFNKNNK